MFAVALSEGYARLDEGDCAGLPYDCDKCTKDMQRLRGCVEDSPDRAYWLKQDDVRNKEKHFYIKRCPLKAVTSRMRRIIQSCNAFEAHGILPDAGGWLNQSAAWVQALSLVALSKEVMRKDNAR